MIDLQLLRLDTLIIHRVPKKARPGEAAQGPTLSTAPTPDRPEVKAFFQRRIRAAVAEDGHPIEPDPSLDRMALDAIATVLADGAQLTPRSRELATRLFEVQDLRNTEGLLVAATGTMGQRRIVALLKLEHDSGIRAEERRDNGEVTFEVVVHDDLLLTPHTQLFKGAVFARDANGVEAVGADLQVVGIADFFLKEFLGFRLVETPAVTTERLLDSAEKWIARVPDAEKQTRYEIALLAQLQSARRQMDIPAFANASLDLADRQSFREAIQNGGVRWGSFAMDTSGIEGRIKRVAYSFESGIKIVGRREAVEEHVRVEQLRDSLARVTVEDGLASVHSHG